MVTVSGWVLAVCLYLAFNLGFMGATIFNNLQAYRKWKPEGWRDWAYFAAILVSPIPVGFTVFAISDRLLLAYRWHRKLAKT